MKGERGQNDIRRNEEENLKKADLKERKI